MSEPKVKSITEYHHEYTGNLVKDLKTFIWRGYKLKKNLISRCIELDGKPIDDDILNEIYITARTEFSKATKELVTSIIYSNFIPSYNPFFEYLEGLPIPKQTSGHIDAVIATITTDTANAPLFIKKWLVSIISSLYYEHSPLLLVLCGAQNTGKTQWFRRLLPDQLKKYYAESKLDAGKDDEILMTKKLIIMDDEMGGKSKTEQRILKQMTSKEVFTVRKPYGRVSEELHRLALLCGTSNDEELINDPTGNRRILPVRVLSIDIEAYNNIDKSALLYELWQTYKNGYDCNLSKEDIETLKNSTQEFKQSSSEEELILKYYSHPNDKPGAYTVERTNSEILSYIQTASNVKLSQTKLGLVLKQIGFAQKHKKINETTIRVYSVIENDLAKTYTTSNNETQERDVSF
jgi:predicted P-loop ATPase